MEDITEALWGTKVGPGTVSNLNKKIYDRIEKWRTRPTIKGSHPYVYLDGIVLKRSWAGEVRNVSVLVAVRFPVDGVSGFSRIHKTGIKHLWVRGIKGVNFATVLKATGINVLRATAYKNRKMETENCQERIVDSMCSFSSPVKERLMSGVLEFATGYRPTWLKINFGFQMTF